MGKINDSGYYNNFALDELVAIFECTRSELVETRISLRLCDF